MPTKNPNAVAMPVEQVDKFTRYSQLMAASQGFVVQEILSSYFFDEHRVCWMSAQARAAL